jgi:imidazoleglycerol-phosphate dehydratase
VEDLGLCLGRALRQAVGDGRGIHRYGQALLPMDEALVLVALDLSGRPFLAYEVELETPRLGELDAELLPVFLRACVQEAGLTLHLRQVAGRNGHHIVEAIFKGLGRALRQATGLDPRLEGVPSTKGTLGW